MNIERESHSQMLTLVEDKVLHNDWKQVHNIYLNVGMEN